MTDAGIRQIAGQTDRIKFNDLGSAWIKAHVKGRADDAQGDEDRWIKEARLHMPQTAMSLQGSKEAEALLNTALREYLPDIINKALLNARNGNREAVADIKRISEEL